MAHKVLYTSDMHGNKSQFKTLVEHALKIKPNILIIGGELAPKNLQIPNLQATAYIHNQRRFLETDLPTLMQPLRDNLPETQIFVMMGNDDCYANRDVLQAHSELYKDIDGSRFDLEEGYQIVGYSNVPITPFLIKDGEKHDLTYIPSGWSREYSSIRRLLKETHEKASFDGIKSKNLDGLLQWEMFFLKEEENPQDSIQNDLKSEVFTANPEKTIYVFHTPTYGDGLDRLHDGRSVGSLATREFAQKQKRHLMLSGHIHEAVEMNNGCFMERVGSTITMSAGNNNYDNKLAVLTFDLENPESAKRTKLPCTVFGKAARRLIGR